MKNKTIMQSSPIKHLLVCTLSFQLTLETQKKSNTYALTPILYMRIKRNILNLNESLTQHLLNIIIRNSLRLSYLYQLSLQHLQVVIP